MTKRLYLSKNYLLYEPELYDETLLPLLRQKTGLSFVKLEFKKHRIEYEPGSLLIVLAKDSSLSSWLYRMRSRHVSILILPNDANPMAKSSYALPSTYEEALELLSTNCKITRHIIAIGEEVLLQKAVVGDESWLESASKIKIVLSLIRHITSLRLFPVTIQTETKRFQSALFLMETSEEAYMHQIRPTFFLDNPNLCERVTSVLYAPQSIIEAIKLRLFFAFHKKKGLPHGIGTIKSGTFTLSSDQEFAITYNGKHHTSDNVCFRHIQTQFELYTGWKECASGDIKESIRIEHIPTKPDMIEFFSKITLPLLPIASEEAFAELFKKIRQNANMSATYLFLLIISVLMAAIGLFQDSSPTIIGAMILAPLMGPLLSFSMGSLRFDQSLIKSSLFTILLSILLGLALSALLTHFIPIHHLTEQMSLRTHPTLLDLGVAILAGLAAGYGMANSQVGESLAGVAIAVALIPPLCVAGIGLGWQDLTMFSNAFLLFLTNIIGIVFAAGLMFYLLGFASKRYVSAALAIKLLMVAIIALPLYIATTMQMQKEFLYETIVQSVPGTMVEKIVEMRERQLVYIDILAKDKDIAIEKLKELKEKYPNLEFIISYKEAL